MKIYAYRLSLSFELRTERNYQFTETSWSDFLKQLALHTPFDGQIFYVRAEDNNTFEEEVFAFQAKEQWRQREFSVKFLFEHAAHLEAFLLGFQGRFKKKIAAGGLVQNENGDYLFILHHGHWSLPKGHVEPGEDIADTAVREVQEETGLKNVSIVAPLEETHHTFLTKDKWKWKVTGWYQMSASVKEKLSPQVEEGVTEAIWVNPAKWLELQDKAFPLVKQMLKNRL